MEAYEIYMADIFHVYYKYRIQRLASVVWIVSVAIITLYFAHYYEHRINDVLLIYDRERNHKRAVRSS